MDLLLRAVLVAWGLSLLLLLVLFVGPRLVARIQFRRQLQSYYATLDRQARDKKANGSLEGRES